jgi:U3 small nucleolar RNA-associated protein 6
MDALRRKRIKRLGVKSKGSGQKTIFFLYQRAVRKFGGDMDLWLQYIEFAKEEKAFKKLNEIFTSVVRLHPAKPSLWIYAAHYFMESQADITSARSYMQRGLRFNKNSETLWLEYAKLETIYIGKIAGRRKILGLDLDRTQAPTEDDPDGGMIALPSITAEDVNPALDKDEGDDQVALQNLAEAPILTGAIPIAIFDSAMKQFSDDPQLAQQFFDMFTDFDQLPCLNKLLRHVLEHLQKIAPRAASTTICEFKLQLLGIPPTSSNFPSALRTSLGIIDTAISQSPKSKARVAEVAVRVILPLLRTVEEMDELALKKVLLSSLRKYSRLYEEVGAAANGDMIAGLVENLHREKKAGDASRLVQASTKQWGANEKLQQLSESLMT